MIECTGCRELKDVGEFHNVKKWRRCKVCLSVSMRVNYNKSPEVRQRIKVSNRVKLLKKYSLTWEDFNALLTAQSGGCAICSSKLTTEVGAPRAIQACVDHCHKTGKVRGLLCVNCNLALGYLKDRPELAKEAALYLERSIVCLN